MLETTITTIETELIPVYKELVYLNTQNIPQIYQDLKLDTNKLGCVMLGTEKIYAPDWVKDYLYVDPDKEYINGWIGEKQPHLTLLYGLINISEKIFQQTLEAGKNIGNWEKPKTVLIEEVTYFDVSPNYYCIVAKIKKTEEIIYAHKLFQLLPHINTFMKYKPHITLAYIKKMDEVRNQLIMEAGDELVGQELETTKVFYE